VAVKSMDEEESDDYQDEENEEEKDEEEESNDGEDGVDEDGYNPNVRISTVKLIKMRPVGDVEYEDERLHPNTALFLKDLKKNNKRTWLKG
jgi:hypothetical protein